MEWGEGDRWSKMQKDAPPKVDMSLVGDEIEMLFSGTDDAGEPFVNWYNGGSEEAIKWKRQEGINKVEQRLPWKWRCSYLKALSWNSEV